MYEFQVEKCLQISPVGWMSKFVPLFGFAPIPNVATANQGLSKCTSHNEIDGNFYILDVSVT